MALTLGMVTCDTTDALSLARWWAEQTGGDIVEENDGWFVVVAVPGAPMLGFQRIDDPTAGKNRWHLDLSSQDVDAEVQRLLAAGASLVGERTMPGMRWFTLADPDGNQFCVAPAH